MNRILFELGFEELPVLELKEFNIDFEYKINELLKRNEINNYNINIYSTPRRFVCLIENIPTIKPEKEEIVKGPPENIFYKNGKLTKQGEGFLKSKNIDENDIEIKNNFIFYKKKSGGEKIIDIIADGIKIIIKGIEFKKKMKWDNSGILFSRPIRWIIFLFNNKFIDFELGTIKSSNFSFSNRNIGNRKIEIKNIDDYFNKMRNGYVMLDFEERKTKIIEIINKNVKNIKCDIYYDEELLNEITNLIEYPVVHIGDFSERFLNLPEPIIIAALKQHQRYFALHKNKKLINKFVFISNAPFADDIIVINNNERVLNARLEDAEFYFKQDIEKSLSEYKKDLQNIVFYENLGTIYEKLIRNAKLAEYIDNLLNNKIKDYEKISLITKFDIASNMIRDGKEFTKLQGIIGYYYAKQMGIDENIAIISKEHYLPKTNNDKIPETYTGMVFSIADKIDNICGGFIAGYKPTGNKDIMSIRRDTISMLYLIIEKKSGISIGDLIKKSLEIYKNKENYNEIIEFIKMRIENLLNEYDVNMIRSVLNSNDLIINDIIHKLDLLKKEKGKDDFVKLVIGLKRVSNILKNVNEFGEIKSFNNEYERKLYENGEKIAKENKILVEKKEFAKILKNLLSLRKYIDDFFDNVLVMDENIEIKNHRLAILSRIKEVFLEFADFTQY